MAEINELKTIHSSLKNHAETNQIKRLLVRFCRKIGAGILKPIKSQPQLKFR